MKAESLTIVNNKNQKLHGTFYRNTSKTLVIMCHGIESFTDFPGMEKVYTAYFKTGSSVFFFDFSGYGKSEGKKVLSIKQRVEDIGSVIRYFDEYQEIILYGVSLSGIVVLIAAGKYKKVTKLITINGLFSIQLAHLYLRQAFILYSYLLFHPNSWSDVYYIIKNANPKQITIPVLVVYGEKDSIVKPKQSVDFYKKIRTSKTLITVPNGDHPLMKTEFEKVTISIPQWIAGWVIK